MTVPAWHGLLNFDKPAGWTSRAVVDRVGRVLRKVKVGHAGTLDPLATGVLVVCVGAATRLVERVQEHSKGYRAGLRFGLRSDTDDITGRIEPGGDPADITPERLRAACREFLGPISQVPPKFSAVHVDGQRAYDLARNDQEFALTARTIQVTSIEVIGCHGADAELEIVCGSGTYIRALVRDLGERFGCGAVMTSLRRTFIGRFTVETALSPEDLTVERLAATLLPLKSVLTDEPVYRATAAECTALLQGRAIPCPAEFVLEADRRIAVLDPADELFAFAVGDPATALVHPQRVFAR
jgi:tRNA pseudouridine55 synthase